MSRVVTRSVTLPPAAAQAAAQATDAAAALQAQAALQGLDAGRGAGHLLDGGGGRGGRGGRGGGRHGGRGGRGGGGGNVPPIPPGGGDPQGGGGGGGPPEPADNGGDGGGGNPPGGAGGGGGQQVPLVETPWVQALRGIQIPEAALRFIVIDDGVDAQEELIPLSKESVDQLFSRMDTRRIPYSTVASNRFRLLHHYVRRMTFSGLNIILNDINIELLRNEALIVQSEPPKAAKSKIPLPAKFQDDKSWTTFKNALANYLKSVRGAGQVPMVYLIRSDNGGLVGEALDPAVANAPLTGPMFNQDNRELYCILDELTHKGPGETIVRRFKTASNGRAAYLALDTHFSGGSFKTLKVKNANDVNKGTKFTGSSSMSFETYRRLFTDAYTDLAEVNQPVAEQTKVLDFLDGITMPELQSAIHTVHTSEEMLLNFDKASTFLAGIAVRLKNRKQPGNQNNRSVAVIDTRPRSSKEWRKLSKQEQEQIRKARLKEQGGDRKIDAIDSNAGTKMTKGQPNKAKGDKKSILKKREKLKSKSPTRKVALIESASDDPDDDDEEEVDEEVYTPLAKRFSQTKRVRFGAVYRSIAAASNETYGRGELDSHADNSILAVGKVIYETTDTYKVYGYNGGRGQERTICTVAVAHDLPHQTIILIFNQCFYDNKLVNSLINTNQLRDYGVIVKDTPKRYDSDSPHALFVPMEEDIVKIQLKSRGYVSYFDMRTPTDEELEICPHVTMTSELWVPDSDIFEEAEEAAMERNASSVSVDLRSYRPTNERVEVLAKRWYIPAERVEQTLKATSNLAVRVWDEPRYSRFAHKFRYLSRRQLNTRFYTDTFFSTVKSKAGNDCVQLFVNDLRFMYTVCMRAKGEAPYALRSFIDDVGVPDEMISDNAKEETSKLWNHLVDYVVSLNNRIIHKTFRLYGRTPHEATLGQTPDISHLVDFTFYDHVWYLRPGTKFPGSKRYLGRWLGPARQVSSDLSMKVLMESGWITVTALVQPIKPEEKTGGLLQEIDEFNRNVNEKLKVAQDDKAAFIEGLGVSDEFPEITEESIPDHSAPVSISAATRFHKHSSQEMKPKPDGKMNPIIENINRVLNEYDDEGRTILDIDAITDHYYSSNNDKRSTKGWYFLVRWKNQEENIVRLADIKESHPVLVAQYAKDNGIDQLPGMAWWVPYVLRKAKRIIAQVKKVKTVRKYEKYGIKLPKNVKEALELDKLTKTDHWEKAIQKELENCKVAFEFLPESKRPNPGYKHIRCHLIFDVKADLTRKARFVAGGHLTDPPVEITYSTVASRDSIRIILLLASLNELEVMCADLQNAYLNALPREKVYFTAGPEFGKKQGLHVIIVRALYGLKSSGAAFRSKLAEDLREMGYVPSSADNDVYMKKCTKADGFTYYEYIIVYVDDIICVAENASIFMKKLEKIYKLKNGYHKPETYLGMQLKQSEKGSWLLSSTAYLTNVIRELKERLQSVNMKLPTRCPTPLPSNYRAEMDDSKLLDPEWTNWYQGLIGILRWLTEIGRVDISYAVSTSSSYLVQPRKGHFKAALNIFGYLNKTLHYGILLDAEYPDLRGYIPVDSSRWKEFYPLAKESIPNVGPRGNGVIISAFVDADHAGDHTNRRSHTGIVIFVNKAPILWYSKRQTTVETSSYGSELVAMKTAVEMIEGLRYKLRAFGVPIDGPAFLFCDNQSVVFSASTPESALKRKHNAIAYHKVRESAASGAIAVFKVGTDENLSDLLTKNLNGRKTSNFAGAIHYAHEH